MKILPLLLLSVFASAAPVKMPVAATDGLGVNIHFTDAKPGELEMMEAAGVRWIRMDFMWGATERKRGEYDFAAYDRLLASLEQHGMRAIFILDYGNTLYEPTRSVRTEAGREAYAKWAAAALTHFQGHGIYWEMWNEPNGGFWSPKANVDEYCAMALAAGKAMRAAAPDETIIGPATSTIDMDFIEACGKAGLFAYWDAISVHPYRQEGPESVALEYAKLRRMVAKYRDLPIISGEWGYSSAWKNHDPERQGKMLPREWLMNIANGIPVSIWYDWHEDGTDPKEAEHHFGIVGNAYHAGANPVYEPKPAYQAAQALTAALKGAEFLRRLALGDSEDYVLLFQKGAGLTVAAWTTATTPHRLELPGTTALTLTEAPQYLDLPAGDTALAAVPARRPLRATLAPAGETLRVRVENLGTEKLSAEVQLTETPAAAQPLSLSGTEPEKTVTFALDKALADSFRAGARIVQGGQVLLEVPPAGFTHVKAEPWLAATVRPDGDAKVASEQSLTPSDAPEPPPSGSAEVLKLDYKMEPGWRFLQVEPPHGAAGEIPGKPRAFGLWVYGDGEGGSPRLRVVDASGQTFQPATARIDWKGWRYVEFPLSSETAHWGGSKDGDIHYPLRWDTFFLLDKPREHELKGELYLTRPWVIE